VHSKVASDINHSYACNTDKLKKTINLSGVAKMQQPELELERTTEFK
jgi:hypothetical protein